jgi:hypothetical protein
MLSMWPFTKNLWNEVHQSEGANPLEDCWDAPRWVLEQSTLLSHTVKSYSLIRPSGLLLVVLPIPTYCSPNFSLVGEVGNKVSNENLALKIYIEKVNQIDPPWCLGIKPNWSNMTTTDLFSCPYEIH